MSPNIESVLARMEPDCLSYNESVAISLKRIADALENLSGEGYLGWKIVDLAGVIQEKAQSR